MSLCQISPGPRDHMLWFPTLTLTLTLQQSAYRKVLYPHRSSLNDSLHPSSTPYSHLPLSVTSHVSHFLSNSITRIRLLRSHYVCQLSSVPLQTEKWCCSV